jgi:single-strand selective monofunctional uracil DNA glycosylase
VEKIFDDLLDDLEKLRFRPPVTHIYNPLAYARRPFSRYISRFGSPPKEVLLMGMNPGPWGMAQTGIPFGEIHYVTQWLKIFAAVDVPSAVHPKRPVQGYLCPRSEVSGRRLWGWAQARFKTPQRFFKRFWVANYCPLMFLETSGRNRTPDKIPVRERRALLAACDRALKRVVSHLSPRYVIGIGNFAAARVESALAEVDDVQVGKITHPSPANPKANKGWAPLIEGELRALGIIL